MLISRDCLNLMLERRKPSHGWAIHERRRKAAERKNQAPAKFTPEDKKNF